MKSKHLSKKYAVDTFFGHYYWYSKIEILCHEHECIWCSRIDFLNFIILLVQWHVFYPGLCVLVSVHVWGFVLKTTHTVKLLFHYRDIVKQSFPVIRCLIAGIMIIVQCGAIFSRWSDKRECFVPALATFTFLLAVCINLTLAYSPLNANFPFL